MCVGRICSAHGSSSTSTRNWDPYPDSALLARSSLARLVFESRGHCSLAKCCAFYGTLSVIVDAYDSLSRFAIRASALCIQCLT